jgi:hypothetical protein
MALRAMAIQAPVKADNTCGVHDEVVDVRNVIVLSNLTIASFHEYKTEQPCTDCSGAPRIYCFQIFEVPTMFEESRHVNQMMR